MSTLSDPVVAALSRARLFDDNADMTFKEPIDACNARSGSTGHLNHLLMYVYQDLAEWNGGIVVDHLIPRVIRRVAPGIR